MFNLYIYLVYVKESFQLQPSSGELPPKYARKMTVNVAHKNKFKKLGKPEELIRKRKKKILLAELLIYHAFVFLNPSGNVGRVVQPDDSQNTSEQNNLLKTQKKRLNRFFNDSKITGWGLNQVNSYWYSAQLAWSDTAAIRKRKEAAQAIHLQVVFYIHTAGFFIEPVPVLGYSVHKCWIRTGMKRGSQGFVSSPVTLCQWESRGTQGRGQGRLVLALAPPAGRGLGALCVHPVQLSWPERHQAAHELSPPCLSWHNCCCPGGEFV